MSIRGHAAAAAQSPRRRGEFPHQFTANYLFLVNATESDLPRVNQASLARKPELDTEWAKLSRRHLAAVGTRHALSLFDTPPVPMF
ncbi:MAG: hypothetical protein MUC97_14390 [Bernardetiaceae bacterium]|jgi:hypothetical protein|nr:hypothetical protein [Bernardetiaceae bacterium]